MNRTQHTGRITKDLELKQTTNGGKSYVRFTLAVKRKYKNAQGEYDSDFFVIKAWDKLAERLVQFQGKGSKILVEGRLESGSYVDAQSGKTIFTTEIIAEDIEFLESKNARNNANNSANQANNNYPAGNEQNYPPNNGYEANNNFGGQPPYDNGYPPYDNGGYPPYGNGNNGGGYPNY